jgi:hypothetical protein
MMKRRYPIAMAVLLGGAIAAVPAQSMSVQPGISPGGGTSSRLVDPDERTEQMVDQTQRTATQGQYDRESAASVMQFGNAGFNAYGPTR